MADGIALDPGCRFLPSDDGLITLFLRPKIAEEPFEERIVNNADVYSEDPAELVAQHTRVPGTQGNTSVWYFFCPPRYTSKRAGAGGGGESVWKSEGGKKPVKAADGRRVGNLQKFSYGVYESTGSARTFTRLGWCMTEYSLDDDAIGAEKQVLCKVYRSPRALCAEARTAAAGSPCSGSKRKADDAVGDLPEAPPSARPRQEAGSEYEHEQPDLPPDEPLPRAPMMEVAGGGSEDEFIQTEQQQPELHLDFDLEGMEALLSDPVDENLTWQSSTATEEQCTRYPFDDDIDVPWPWTSTSAEVVDGGRGDERIQTEHEQPQSPPDFDLEGVLPAPTDQNLIGQSSTVMEEQCTRYLFDDDVDVSWPWTPTAAKVVDGGRGDGLIPTVNGLRADADIISLLAAGQTVDDIFGADQ
uniref:NAC domain-containing protein n=1 Tax=Oryza brachyantha TaxID=4533 RepID=J3LUI8_ORYBR